ncbi:trypsin eta-like [Belonocnema kinseyi]|uniref:trypsin eta-like n=1 Tax=Belonocnema kinseyi TaxID=2817044 RepID=UPI00143D0913|nr:trypsin eta-like [Belonocnema kinseyi]
MGTSRRPIAVFEMATITGWGAVREGGSTSNVQQTVDVPIVSKAVCNENYYSDGGLSAGNSGGPLTIAGKLAGTVFWGNGCAREGYSGAYTEVAAYRKLVMENALFNYSNLL